MGTVEYRDLMFHVLIISDRNMIHNNFELTRQKVLVTKDHLCKAVFIQYLKTIDLNVFNKI